MTSVRESGEGGREAPESATAGASPQDGPPSNGARRILVALAAAVAANDLGEMRQRMNEALRKVPAAPVEEILLQSHLFLGFPAALTALTAWRSIAGPRPPDHVSEDERSEGWERRGEEVCRLVYGRAYARLRDSVRRAHPEMDSWMIREGYGKVLGRPGVDLATRELCIVATLAATGWEPQLLSHLHGALNAGCRPGLVSQALESGLGHVTDDEWVGRARELWARVRRRFEHEGA